jgi:hypothetical protein
MLVVGVFKLKNFFKKKIFQKKQKSRPRKKPLNALKHAQEEDYILSHTAKN